MLKVEIALRVMTVRAVVSSASLRDAMRKILKITLIVFLSIVLVGVSLKGWFIFQQKYICEPKVRSSVEHFFKVVQMNKFETMLDNSMFINKEHFENIQSKISNTYLLEIKDWGADDAAYTIAKMDEGTVFALMLVPTETATFGCWGAEYKVLTIR